MGLASNLAEMDTSRVLAHEFELLGSGWTTVRHGQTCNGIEGIAYPTTQSVDIDPAGKWLVARLPKGSIHDAQTAWRMVDGGYEPIDWQLDFRSGWRWSELTWYRDVGYGSIRGADVKLPWELARMQHLPRLALAAAKARGLGDPTRADACAREFRNQVLDFIATNPPRFGVNWVMTMDVAIRVTNWLVAWDLFVGGGVSFDEGFEQVFRRSVLDHGLHIVENLEWHFAIRGNHYLADVVGLLFVAAYLPPSGRSDAWLGFAAAELVAEAERQLLPDGAGFEASTSYHRLSCEMITYGVALLAGLSDADRDRILAYRADALPRHVQFLARPPIDRPPAWLYERLELSAAFASDLTKPSGKVVQIGDNDNGRLLKLIPSFVMDSDEGQAMEDHLDHRHLIAAIGGLLDREDLVSRAESWRFEADLVRGLATSGDRQIAATVHANNQAETIRIGTAEGWSEFRARLAGLPDASHKQLSIEVGPGARQGLSLCAYPGFGVYVFRSDRLFLAVRCGSAGEAVGGNHAHNDQLGIELSVDGQDWIRDPGTYVYTPLPERRNAYRSVHGHFAPSPRGREPASLDLGLFELGPGSAAGCVYWGEAGFAGTLALAGGGTIHAALELTDTAIDLHYGYFGCEPDDRILSASSWRDMVPTIPFSRGYGHVEAKV